MTSLRPYEISARELAHAFFQEAVRLNGKDHPALQLTLTSGYAYQTDDGTMHMTAIGQTLMEAAAQEWLDHANTPPTEPINTPADVIAYAEKHYPTEMQHPRAAKLIREHASIILAESLKFPASAHTTATRNLIDVLLLDHVMLRKVQGPQNIINQLFHLDTK